MSVILSILCALDSEAGPIISTLGLNKRESPIPECLHVSCYSTENEKLLLIDFGKCPNKKSYRIGTQFASIVAFETLRSIKPKYIASVGTAGGFKSKGAKIGDVFISKGNISYHGRHIPISSFNEYETGHFLPVEFKNNCELLPGTITSSDSIPLSPLDLEKIKKLKTDAKDMEAAAIAEAASLTQTPMFALKAITDFVDLKESTEKQFRKNFTFACRKNAEALLNLIKSNHQLSNILD